MKTKIKVVLSLLLAVLTIMSPVSILKSTITAQASYGGDQLVSRVWQYCIDLDRGLVNQVNQLDLSNINDYNTYVNIVNLVNNSKKESRDLLNIAGYSGFSVDDTFVAHSLRKGMQEDLVFRASLGLSGLIFNSDAIKYLTGQNVAKDKYKKALKSFMNASKADMELLNTSKQVISILKALSPVIDNETGRAAIHSAMLSIYAAKSTDDVRYALKYAALDDYLKGDESVEFECGNVAKLLGTAGDTLSITQITVNGIYNLASVSSNLELYREYGSFLTNIENDTSLPVSMRKAAQELNSDLASQYAQAAKDIVNEIKGFFGGKSLSLAAQEMGSAVIGDVLSVISIGKLFYNVLIGAKDIVESCSAVECYDTLASKYAKIVLNDKRIFSLNPTRANAEQFRFDYEILQKLRLEGEKKALAMIGFDSLWTKAQRSLMRTVVNYKENKVQLKNNIAMIESAAFTNVDDGKTRELKPKPFYDTTVNVQCPVNVTVYDKNNNLVASVVDEKLNEPGTDASQFPIVVYTEDNDKIVRMVSSNDYRVEIQAYAQGKMTYTATRYVNNNELASETEYESVSIDKGDSFVANPEEAGDTACRALYSTNGESMSKLEPTREYDNKKLPDEEADTADVIVAEELFEDLSQELITKVADAMFSFSPSVDISSFNISTDETVALFSAVAKYYPSEYSLISKSDFTYKIIYSPSRGVITSIRFYYGENANIDNYRRRVNETNDAINSLVQKTKGMTDFEKALYVHDYIVLNCEYDLDLLAMLEADGTLDGEIRSERYTEYSVLVNGTGICGSYALAYRAVMNACGVDCLYLSSKEMNHAWNLIKLDGKWYHVDCCWDDPVPDTLGIARRTYFLRTDDEIMQLDHYSWTPGSYKATSSKYSAMPREYDGRQKYDSGRWYYLDSGSLYSCNQYGGDKKEISAVTANSIDVDGGEIYYSYGRGIYELNETNGGSALSYYLPDSVSGDLPEYTFIRNMFVDGDSLSCFAANYRGDAYEYKKYEKSSCFSQAERVNGLALNLSSVTLDYGEKKQLTCSLSQKDEVKNIEPMWTSSDSSIVTVDQSGLLRAKDNGTAVVSAVWNGLKASCSVNVSYNIDDVEKVKMLSYKIEDNRVIITDCDARITGAFELPSTLDGYPVTSIGDYAFYNCDSLTSITIPGSVTSIDDDAFYNCDSLTSITIPNSVTSIGDNAFAGCDSLTSITIPQSVTSIRSSLFGYCDSLTSITVDKGNKVYDSRSNCNAIIETDTNTLISGCQSTVIPNSVTSIGKFAFWGCDSLTSITIPQSVTSIRSSLFGYCKSLKSITVDKGNKVYDSRNNCNAIIETDTNSLISGCQSTVIPNSVTSIGADAFWGCDSLTSINIPQSVTSIGDYAFWGCDSLTSIIIPYSVTSIGNSAFDECNSLTSITIPDSVTSIGYSAFSNCWSLTSITIPNSVTSIGDFAFDECYSLTSITIPGSVTSIGGGAFVYCGSLTSITIPDSVTSIGGGAFYGCDSLTSITIPDSVTSIGDGAFEYCNSLKNVYYTGSEEQWNKIDVYRSNEPLLNATIHYNYVPHKHSYSSSVTKEASCTKDGVLTFACDCGESYTEIIPATGHKYKLISSDPGSCTSASKDVFECENCHDKKTVSKKPENHIYNIVIHEPTCTKSGYTEAYCTLCKESVMYDFKAPKGHEMTAVRSQATCTKHASVSYSCSVCGYEYVTEDTDSAYGSHSYTAKVTKSTCLDGGFTTYTCTECGHSYVGDYKDVGDHTPGKWQITVAATSKAPGEKVRCCTVCGKVLEKETIPALKADVKSISVDDIALTYKKSSKLNPKITADEGAEYTVKYKSSNPKVATVDKNGKVYAAKRGTAEITCTVTDSNGNTFSDKCKVTVKYTFGQWLIKILLFGWIWY